MMNDSSTLSTSPIRGPSSRALSQTGFRLAPVRLHDLRDVARLQRRAFKPKLAYGMGTLLLLWALPSVRFEVARERS